MMQKDISGWVSVGKQRLGNYGVQRCYDKATEQFFDIDEIPFNTDT
jgi:hypothetical protein